MEVCHGPECRECGGPELLAELTGLGIAAEPGHCQGLCHYAPMALIGNRPIPEATADKIAPQPGS
ncbi:MAG TPA: (2Fe-2S) ferredoxin domain-containing protein [Mariprofundaceae bacterium]|nr:(2Fe-2S) ferredoxin domain-containing protein [Mariprofundaceae bacterium]